MAVPEQVKQQIDEVEALRRQVYGDDDNITELNPGEVTAEITVNDEETRVTSEDFEQKWRTLQGMHNKTQHENSELKSQNQSLHSRVLNVEALLGTMNVAQQKTEKLQAPKTLVSDSEIEDYGEEAVDLMRRVTQEGTTPINERLNSLAESVERLQSTGNAVATNVQHVADRQHKTSEQAYWDGLNELVPDWEEVNADSGFRHWLLETDALSGIQRQIYLVDAEQKHDHARVAGFFDMWKRVSGKGTTKNTPTTELQSLVAPNRGNIEPSTNRVDNEKLISRSQVEKFYTDLRNGKYTDQPDEAKKIEAAIFEAMNSGRLT